MRYLICVHFCSICKSRGRMKVEIDLCLHCNAMQFTEFSLTARPRSRACSCVKCVTPSQQDFRIAKNTAIESGEEDEKSYVMERMTSGLIRRRGKSLAWFGCF